MNDEILFNLDANTDQLLSSALLRSHSNKASASHHCHPADGRNALTDGRQVVEEAAAAVPFPETLDLLDVIGNGLQQVSELHLRDVEDAEEEEKEEEGEKQAKGANGRGRKEDEGKGGRRRRSRKGKRRRGRRREKKETWIRS